MKKHWKRRMARYVGVAGVMAGMTGCGSPATPSNEPRVPAPVVEQGMTLYWGNDVKQAAIRLIDASHHYVDLDIYELSDPDILASLQRARQRGVDTRVVLDATEPNSTTIGRPTLERDAVPVETLHIPQGISHLKMLVSDGHVLIGGMNFGAHSWENNDASVLIQRANPSFRALFQWDWSRAGNQPASAPSYQLPLLDDRANETEMVQAIQEANRTVQMEAFDLSDYAVVDALDQAVKRGVTVEILLDPGQSWSKKAMLRLSADGASVRYYTPYQGEWMHAKILDVDNGKTFIIGSANFSHQAFTYNHEADILLQDVPLFDKALASNLSYQFTRGTDTPTHHDWGTNSSLN